ncbi:MAG: mechanosensitive ion channel family protein [Proteobacteria bacterium]|nr:mechanosensitive ion channel family protein [Pseudomonadota bacterium]
MPGWRELWHMEFLGNELGSWVLAAVVFLVTFTVLPLAGRFISAQRRRFAKARPQNPHHAFDLAGQLLTRTNRFFLWGVAVWLASRDLTFPARIERLLTITLVTLFWMQMALWAMAAVRFAIEVRQQRSGGADTLLKGSMQVIVFATGLLIWGVAVLLALQNLGVQIAPLLAGLGIGGIALALAVQTVLADLLASLSIALDRPFVIGDMLGVDDCQGSVEHIGVKSTRLRSVTGEQIVFANADLLKARVRNFGRMVERRSLFRMAVHYETPVSALAAVPRTVREIIEATPNARFDRCHLLSFGDAALLFEVVFYVNVADFKVYADAQQRINLRILERLGVLGVTFAGAAPTTIRVNAPPAAAPAAAASAGGQQQRLL